MLHSSLKTNLFIRDKIILINLIISVLLNLFCIIWLYFKITPQVEPLALHYTIYFGIDLIGVWYKIFVFPLIGLLTILINFSLAYIIFIKVKILAYISAVMTSAIQILIVIISILISLLNT